MLASCAFLGVLAGLGRMLGKLDIEPAQTVFFRLLFAWLCLAPLMLRRGIAGIATDQLRIYMLRAVVSMIAMWTWFYGVSLIPIGELTALSFLSPMFTTVGAMLLLGEVVRLQRWAAILIGFCGALIIIRPGMVEMTAGHWFALVSALTMGCSALIIKRLTRQDDSFRIVFISHSLMLPLALVPALLVWRWPDQEIWLLLMATGPVAVLGHLTLTRAYSLADASLIAVVDYARLPFAVLVGWVLFGEITDLMTWIGATVIFASSLFILRREMMLKQQGRIGATR